MRVSSCNGGVNKAGIIKSLDCHSLKLHVPVFRYIECVFDSRSLKLCEPVGEGNFGVVYRAQLRDNDRYSTVAVKMLKGCT